MKFNKKHMTVPVIIAFAGALLSALAAIWSSINQAEESDKNSKLNERLAAKSDEIAEYAKKQEKASDENKKLNQQLAAKSDTIAKFAQEQVEKLQELQKKQDELDKKAAIQDQKTDVINQQTKELANLNLQLFNAQKEVRSLSSESLSFLTGGDSYCYIVLTKPFYGDKELDIYLHHVGKYPLTALRITITRETAARRESNDAISMYKFLRRNKYYLEIPIGPLPKLYKPILIGKIPVDPGLRESFEIFFYAQNGVWIQSYWYDFNEYHQSKTSYYVLREGEKLIDEPNHKYF